MAENDLTDKLMKNTWLLCFESQAEEDTFLWLSNENTNRTFLLPLTIAVWSAVCVGLFMDVV